MEQKLNTAYFSYIMVLRVLQLEPEDQDYIMESMHRCHKAELPGV